jgi:hypothetical protein
VLAVVSEGWPRTFFAVLAFFALVAAAWILSLRMFVLHVLRRMVGGEHYHRVAPLVSRRVDDVKGTWDSLPVTRLGALQWMLLALRPRTLQERVRETGDLVLKRVPALVRDVGAVLEGS